MKRKNKLMKASIAVILTTLFAAGAMAAWNGHRVNYNYQTESVSSLAYNCQDENCTVVDSFGGSYPDGKTSSDGTLTIDFPKDRQDEDYAVFMFSDAHVPKAYRAYWYCTSGDYCGPSEVDVNFTKIDQCSATVDGLSVENSIYRNKEVVVDVSTDISTGVQSPFEENSNYVEYVPEDQQIRDKYYSALTNVTIQVQNENDSTTFTNTYQKNIFMGGQDTVKLDWTPSETGNHSVSVSSDVVDPVCRQSNKDSITKDFEVHPTYLDEEYYTLINDLNIQDDNPTATEKQTMSYTKISNYARSPSDRSPVKTNIEYTVKDNSSKTVLQKSKTLKANPNAEDPVTHSFTWTPNNSGQYTVTVRGESIKEFTDNETNPEKMSLNVTVQPEPDYRAKFTVNDGEGNLLENASVKLGSKSNLTNKDGFSIIRGLQEGNYNYTISKQDYEKAQGTLNVESDSPETIERSVTLHEENTAPSISGFPSKLNITEGESRNVDLNRYVQDDQTSAENLEWNYSGNQEIGVTIDQSNTATITSENWTGTEKVTFTVKDPEGLSDQASTQVEVRENNTAPAIKQIPDKIVEEDTTGNQFNIKQYIKDEESAYDDLKIELTRVTNNNQCGVNFDQSTVSINPETDFYGQCKAEIKAEDPEGLSDKENLTVIVEGVNDAPVITSNPNTTAKAYSTYKEKIGVDHPSNENQDLTYTVTEGPSGLNTENESLIWDTPTNNDAGTYQVEVKVSDGLSSDTINYTLEVVEGTPTNPPEAKFKVNTTKGGAPLTVQFNASTSTDPDGNITNYKWDYGDGQTNSGQITKYTYTVPRNENYTVTLTVTDNTGAKTTASKEINVTGNIKPRFTSDATTSVKVGENYEYNAKAVNEDNDPITYGLDESPTDMQINENTGKITWTPQNTGTYDIVVSATDGRDTTLQTYQLTVNPADDDNDEDDGDTGGGGDSGSGSDGGSSGGGSPSGSSGSSGGGGGSFYSPISTSVEQGTETIESRVNFVNDQMNLEVERGESTISVPVNFTKSTRLSLRLKGNLTEITSLEGNVKRSEGVQNINLSVNASQEGLYSGNLTLKWSNQSLSMPLDIRVTDSDDEVDVDATVVILTDSAKMSTESPSYSVKVMDNSHPDTEESGEIVTRIENEDGEMVYQNSEEFELKDTIIEDFEPSELAEGTYTIEADVSIEGNQYTGFKTVEVRKGNSITGQFTSGPLSFLSDIWEAIKSLF